MIRFHNITLRNFLSYGNNITTINLDNPGTTLIVGEDLDNTSTGQGANGTGKSSILNALCYAVYDRPVSNISKDNLVNNINKSNMEVSVEFTVHSKKKYLIKRIRKSKNGAAGNNAFLYEDDKDITLDSVANTNKLIESIIGIPYELFVRIVVFSAANTPFLDLPLKSSNGANQTDIIEELFGLTMLSLKASALKDTIKETEGKSMILRSKISLLEQEKVRHEEQVAHAKLQVIKWQASTDKQILQLLTALTQAESVDIDQLQQLDDQLNSVTKDINEAQVLRKEQATHYNSIVSHIKTKQDDLEHLRNDKCPYCKQQYVESPTKILNNEQILITLNNEKLILEQEGKKLKDSIVALEHKLNSTKTQMGGKKLYEMITIKNQTENAKSKISDLKQTPNPMLVQLEYIENIKLEQIDYNEVNQLENQLEHLKFLHKILTKKDSFVRKALINKNIPFLNSKLQQYLTILGLPHRVEFTHEMTAEITQFGQSLDFGNLSAGQRARVNLALSFSFRDVLQTLHTPINVCVLDEVLDIGLDSIGVQAAARLLKRKARDEQLSMFIISHRDEIKGIFDNTLTVQLNQGFSFIKEHQTDNK